MLALMVFIQKKVDIESMIFKHNLNFVFRCFVWGLVCKCIKGTLKYSSHIIVDLSFCVFCLVRNNLYRRLFLSYRTVVSGKQLFTHSDFRY